MTTLPVIIKADGSKEEFDPARLVVSLRRAGAGEYAAERITSAITDTVVPGVTSKEIYSRAFAL
ncbi:MAG: ATP cone domain-containing protein, partial [bacterium]|nr:ATP cone domain-containing protein [bacterium]